MIKAIPLFLFLFQICPHSTIRNMAIIEHENRHSVASRKALDYLKELCSSLDGFDLKSEKNGVKLYSRAVPGNSVDIVRGETVFKTTEFSPRDLASMATEPGVRTTCKYSLS